jgi:hypothetical protein
LGPTHIKYNFYLNSQEKLFSKQSIFWKKPGGFLAKKENENSMIRKIFAEFHLRMNLNEAVQETTAVPRRGKWNSTRQADRPRIKPKS